MLKKIFKTILVLSICVGISLPTNAAVSVSDGSAFVTKAEFAADLNNLSNRMAQLENSLDAKIDSLVSSYLTRNGIWNGARQSLINNTIKYGLKSKSTKSTTFKNYMNLETSGAKLVAYDCYEFVTVGNHDYLTLIESVTKSGLLVISLVDGTTIQSNQLLTLPYGATGFNGAYMNWAYIVKLQYVVNNGGSRSVVGALDQQYVGTSASLSLVCPKLSTNSILFFVSKGDAVETKLNEEIRTNGTNPILGCYFPNKETSNQIIISEAYIY